VEQAFSTVMAPLFVQLLGADYAIHQQGLIVNMPNSEDQSWHRDGPHLFQKALPAHSFTVFVPLVDFTPENGSTEFIPGSNSYERKLDGTDVQAETMTPLPKRGDITLFDFRTLHRGVANSSSHVRPAVYFVAAKAWYRDDGNAFPKKHSIFADRVLCSHYRQGDVPAAPKKKPNKKMAALKAALMLKAMFGGSKSLDSGELQEQAAALGALTAEARALALSSMSAEEQSAALGAMSEEHRMQALTAMSAEERAVALAVMADGDRAAAESALALVAVGAEEAAAAQGQPVALTPAEE